MFLLKPQSWLANTHIMQAKHGLHSQKDAFSGWLNFTGLPAPEQDRRKRFRLYCAQLFQGIVMTRLGTALRPAATRVMLLGSGELERGRH
jgi:hypothetical protein